MIRKPLAIVLGLLVASGGAALAATSATAPTTSSMVRTVKDAAACGGKGFSLITAPATKKGYLCVHNRHDPMGPTPTEFAAAAKASGNTIAARGPATAKVPCYGDGTTGPRIQMIYGYHAGIPNRAKTVVPLIQKVMAPRMQAVINAQSLGRDLGLRFAMTPGCKAIDVKVIEFPESVQDATNPLDPGGQIGRAADFLAAKGFDRADRKYQIMWDGYNGPACGIGEIVLLDPVTSLPVSPLNDGAPTVGARTEPAVGPAQVFSAKYSMIFNHAGGKKGPSCFQRGQSGVTVQLHELFHTLGAVQLDAPNADTGHCLDAPSVMCSGGVEGYGLGIQIPACVKVLVETLDCGMNDYWNPNPRAGDYLSTHLNVAKSQFFGPQPQDMLASSPL